MSAGRPPLGVVLAGGAGRRIGGAKALVELCGRPLLRHPLDLLTAELDEVVVVAKQQTPLPELPPGVAVWREPDREAHPLHGVREALRRAGRPVVVCAGDLPLVSPELVRALAAAASDAPAVVPRAAGRLQPLLARYAPDSLPALEAMGPGEPATAVAERLALFVLEWPEERAFFNVNRPEDLLQAAALLAGS